jgi:phage shock protein A
MGVFSRFSDIVNSNLNAILDRAEDPEKIIRLIIQEMEDTLVEVRADAARMIAEGKDLTRRLERLARARDEWQTRAELALAKDREDLARSALVEKAKLADEVARLESELNQVNGILAQSDADIARLRGKIDEARGKQKLLVARQESAGTRLRVRRQTHDNRIDDAMLRFEAFERKVTEAEARVEAFDLGKTRTLADEIDELDAGGAVEQELASLKQRLGKAANEPK